MVDSHYTFTPLNKGSSNLTCIQFIHLYIHTTEYWDALTEEQKTTVKCGNCSHLYSFVYHLELNNLFVIYIYCYNNKSKWKKEYLLVHVLELPKILYMALIENVHTKCPSWWGGKWQFCANEGRGNALLVLTNGQDRFNRSHFHSLSFPNQSFSKWWHADYSLSWRIQNKNHYIKSFGWNIRARKFKHDLFIIMWFSYISTWMWKLASDVSKVFLLSLKLVRGPDGQLIPKHISFRILP